MASMSFLFFACVAILLWIVPSYLVADYASTTKGQNFLLFFVLGLATSFVVPLVIALVLPLDQSKLFVPDHAQKGVESTGLSRDLDLLERLSDMHDRGILSDDEYVDQKNRILSGARR